MKKEFIYYRLLSVAYNLCPLKALKERIKVYALGRYPEVKKD